MQNTTRPTTAIRRSVGSMLRNSPAAPVGVVTATGGRFLYVMEVGAAHYRVANDRGVSSLVPFGDAGDFVPFSVYLDRNPFARTGIPVEPVETAPMSSDAYDSTELEVEGLGEDDGLNARAAYVETTGQTPEHAADSFTFEPPAPLSGEWAGQLTPNALMHLLGVDPYAVDPEDMSALCDAYEDAFFRAFYAAH